MKKFLALTVMTLSLCSCGEQIDTGNRGLKTMWGEIISEKPKEESKQEAIKDTSDATTEENENKEISDNNIEINNQEENDN